MNGQFHNLAINRYSCRDYQDRMPERSTILQLFETVRVAPSAANAQPWHFIIVDKSPLLNEVKSCYAKQWIQSAPLVIVALGNHNQSWRRADGKEHVDVDLSIAIDHLTLAATDMGLATCWICKFDAFKCAEILNLPKHLSPVALIPLGYPADSTDTTRHAKQRKPLESIISFNGL